MTDLITLFSLREGTDADYRKYTRLTKSRWETFLKSDLHLVAYMLDPQYYGCGLDVDESEKIACILEKYCNSDEQKVQIRRQLMQFK
jgi:hypothetical protein